jgi:hypothetical protein
MSSKRESGGLGGDGGSHDGRHSKSLKMGSQGKGSGRHLKSSGNSEGGGSVAGGGGGGEGGGGGGKGRTTSSKKGKGTKRPTVFRPPSLAAARAQLPIMEVRAALLAEIAAANTVVVVGETGSGKTTQLPQFLYEAGYCADGGLVACMSLSFFRWKPFLARGMMEEHACCISLHASTSITRLGCVSPSC